MKTSLLGFSLVALLACGSEPSLSNDATASTDNLYGAPGPNQDAPVSEIIHDDDYGFACEPNVVHLWNLVDRVSLHTSIPRAQVEAETVIVFGALEDGITPSSVTSDAIGNMIVRVDTGDLAPALTIGDTVLTLEGVHTDGTIFSATGILEVTE